MGIEADMAAPESAEDPENPRRCEFCGGMLYRTLSTAEPRQEDHQLGCEFFAVASQVMQYATQVHQAASGSDTGSRASRRYLRNRSAQLARAARTADPPRALQKLAARYEDEYRKGIDEAAYAHALSQACRALAEGAVPDSSALNHVST